MHILHIMDQSLPKTIGYTIRAKYLIEAQAQAGHKVTVLTSPTQGVDAQDEIINGTSPRTSRAMASRSAQTS